MIVGFSSVTLRSVFLLILLFLFCLLGAESAFAGNTIGVKRGHQPLIAGWNVSGGYGGSTGCAPWTNAAPPAVEAAWMGAGGSLTGQVNLPAPTVVFSSSSPARFRCTHSSGVSDESLLVVSDCAPLVWDSGSNTCVAAPPSIGSFTNNGPIPYNTPATLTWTVSGAMSCTISGIGAVNAAGGSINTPNLTTNTTYTLTCSNANGGAPPVNTPVTVSPPSGCIPPWGGPAVPNGGTITAYQAPSVVAPATCASQVKTCVLGAWTGTYTHQNCSVTAAPLPTLSVCDIGGVNCVGAGGTKTITTGNQVEISWNGNGVTPTKITGPTDFDMPGPSGTDNTVTEPTTGNSVVVTIDNGSGSVTVTISNGSTLANLVSQSLTVPGSGTQGTPINLSAEVRNTSSDTAAGAFSDDFTYSYTGSSGPWTPIPGGVIARPSGLAVNTTAMDNVSFIPPLSGTLYIQHCVDSYNQVPEGVNETPNCRVSGGISVGVPLVDCNLATISGCGLPNGTPGQNYNGTCAAGYAGTCNYTCNGVTGTWQQSGANTCTAPIITQFEVCNQSLSVCDSNGMTVATSTPLVIRWNAPGADRCQPVSGPGFITGDLSSGSDPITSSAVPGAPLTFRILCDRDGTNAVTDSLIVTSNFERPEIWITEPSSSANVSTARIGQPVWLRWDSNNNGNETSCSLTGGGLTSVVLGNGTGDGDTGNADFTVNARTTFTITCNGLSDTVTVDVIPQNWES
jgi:hypothetical protein